MKLNKLARSLALIGIGSQLIGAAFAQASDSAVQRIERVEVTGSSIKRLQDEGALPVQIIKAADLVKQGITSAEQLLSVLASNGNGLDNMVSNQGGDFLNSLGSRSHNNGAASASLRGLGPGYTLVLLNGRRMSTHGLNGSSVDVNSIPMAAVDRIEILKDGASAIYGTDAIGGVINFITRKDFQGLEASVFTDITQEGGGNITRGSVVLGAGSLAADRFNLMASLTYDTQKRLRGHDREFQNGYQPERGLAPDTTGTPFANIGAAGGTALRSSFRLPGDSQSYSRANPLAFASNCNSIPDQVAYRGDITGFNANNKGCAYDYGKQWSLMQPVDRINLVSKASFALSSDHTAFVEVVASRVKSAVEYTPIQLTSGAYNYPANGPYYLNLATALPTFFKPTDTNPTDTRAYFNSSLPERIRWRCIPCGPRQQDTTTDAYRVLTGMEGMLGGWDYKLGLSAAQSKAGTKLGDGNMYTAKITAAMSSGVINPFLLPGQSQTAAAMAAIEGAKARGGSLYDGKASVKQLDATFSKEVFDLPAGKVGAAVGFDFRKENYQFDDGTGDQPGINGAGSSPSLPSVSRDIKAVFAELQIPILKNLEMQLAVRHDRYSDFGGTTNPKAAIRWQPSQQVAFRSSYSTGFHAPDFDALYGGSSTNQFNSDINDPVLCPTGTNPPNNLGCGIRPEILTTSNPNLKAETSKQYTFGIVLSPAPWITSTIDFWRINLDNRIATLSGQTLIKNYSQYSQYVTRTPPVTGEISSVSAPYFNLAGDKASGIDLNVTLNFKTDLGNWVAVFDGSYLDSYKSRYSKDDPWVERVNQFGDASFGWDLKLRWKHNLGVTWSQGNWAVTGTQNYSNGYKAETDGFGSGFTPAQAPAKIDSYTVYHLSTSYTGFKNLTLTAGVKNLLDTKPSFSAHNVDNVAGAGWDARVGDPRMRAFNLRATYKFW